LYNHEKLKWGKGGKRRGKKSLIIGMVSIIKFECVILGGEIKLKINL
jgi:hypothetical protein